MVCTTIWGPCLRHSKSHVAPPFKVPGRKKHCRPPLIKIWYSTPVLSMRFRQWNTKIVGQSFWQIFRVAVVWMVVLLILEKTSVIPLSTLGHHVAKISNSKFWISNIQISHIEYLGRVEVAWLLLIMVEASVRPLTTLGQWSTLSQDVEF